MSRKEASTLRRIVALLMAALAAGCAEPPAVDYRQIYPVPVSAHTEVMPLHVITPSGKFADDEEPGFSALVAAYIERGNGPIMVTARQSSGMDREAELFAVRARLLAAGVPASAIRLGLIDNGPATTVTLSYTRYGAGVPGCGDWSGHTGFNPYNQVHSNFGCAAQHNVGKMVADPADLVRMREADPTDTQNSNRVVQRYRAGQPPGSAPNPLQSSGSTGTSSGAGAAR